MPDQDATSPETSPETSPGTAHQAGHRAGPEAGEQPGAGLKADCLFCRIVAGELPSRRVDADDHAVAFLDLAPFHRGHTLVVPRRHTDDLTEGGLAEIAPMVERVARLLTSRLGADGLNAFSSAGAVAGQEVFHLHVHLVPRYADKPGLRNLFAAKPQADAAELDGVLAQLTGKDPS